MENREILSAADRKRRLRAELLQARTAMPESFFREAGEALRRQLKSLPAWQEARVVFAFLSTAGEPETRGIITDAAKAGKTVLLPRCLPGGRMEALPFSGWERLVRGRFGLWEPEADSGPALAPDLILVPCLAVSPTGGVRLGRGGGYYDRYLARTAGTAVCLCPEEFLREGIPTEETDVPVGWIATSRRRIRCTGPEKGKIRGE